MCLFYKLSAERGWASRKKGKQKEKSLAFFGNHVDISVRICGFEAGNVADLRPDFGIFVDNKYWELPGSFWRIEGLVQIFLVSTLAIGGSQRLP